MTIDELKNLCARITYKGKPCVAVKDYDWRNSDKVPVPVPQGYIYISTWINAVCVKTGEPTKIEQGGLWALKELSETNKTEMLNQIKTALIQLETHEVNELLAIDGVHIFDPHKDQELPKVNLEMETKQAA